MGTRAASGEVRLIVTNNITNTLTDGKANTVSTAALGDTIFSGRLADGVSEEQYSRGWKDERTLNSGATEDIDLYDLGAIDVGAGAGLDALGQALTNLEIVYFGVRQTGGTGRLQINPTDPSNKVAWMPTLTVVNGGALRPPTTNSRYSGISMFNPASDAFPITDGASHMVRFGASGGSVTYEIMLLARHDTDESSSSSQSTKSSLSSASSSSTSSISSVSSSSSSSSHSRSSSSPTSQSSVSTLSSSSSSSTHSVSTSSTLSSSSSSSTSSTLSSSSSSSLLA